jgi:hypothetical protein
LLLFLWVFFVLVAVVGFVVSVDWAAFAAANRPGTATALSIIKAIIFFIFISPFVLAALAASSSTLR